VATIFDRASCTVSAAGQDLLPYPDTTGGRKEKAAANANEESRVGVLDGWRGLSVLLVVISHLVIGRLSYLVSDQPIARMAPENVTGFIPRLAERGGLFGVSIFFAISGLLISTILLKQEVREENICLRDFYLRRAFRILPAFAFYILSTLACVRLGYIDIGALEFIPATTFTCNAMPCNWFFGHLWTLSVEEQFYLTWPLLILAFKTQRIVFARITCALALWLSGLHLLDSYAPTGTGFACIALGSLYAVDPQFAALTRRYASPPVAAASFLFFFSPAVLAPTEATGLLFGVAGPIAAFLILAETLNERSRLRRIVNSSALRRVGLASYSIYLWQQLFTADLSSYQGPSVLLFFPLLFLVSWLSFRLIEQPFIKLGHILTRPSNSGRTDDRNIEMQVNVQQLASAPACRAASLLVGGQ
jgi:peptidoglycan/LPS O-acetylase OafA/YrhL